MGLWKSCRQTDRNLRFDLQPFWTSASACYQHLRLDLDLLARGGSSLPLHPMQNHRNAGREAHVRTPRWIRSIRRHGNESSGSHTAASARASLEVVAPAHHAARVRQRGAAGRDRRAARELEERPWIGSRNCWRNRIILTSRVEGLCHDENHQNIAGYA
jgi:hypothetical protein